VIESLVVFFSIILLLREMEADEFRLGYGYGFNCDARTRIGKQMWMKLCAMMVGLCAISYVCVIPFLAYSAINERVPCFIGDFLRKGEQAFCAPTNNSEVQATLRHWPSHISFYRANKANLSTKTLHQPISFLYNLSPGYYLYYAVSLTPNSTMKVNVKSSYSDTVAYIMNYANFNNFSDGFDFLYYDNCNGSDCNMYVTSDAMDQYYIVAQNNADKTSRVTYAMDVDYLVFNVENLPKCSFLLCTYDNVSSEEIVIAENDGGGDEGMELNYPSVNNPVATSIVFTIFALLLVPVIVLIAILVYQRGLSCMTPKPVYNQERNSLLH